MPGDVKLVVRKTNVSFIITAPEAKLLHSARQELLLPPAVKCDFGSLKLGNSKNRFNHLAARGDKFAEPGEFEPAGLEPNVPQLSEC